MLDIQSVGIREFRANLHKYTSGGKAPIAITSHGEPCGYYIPVRSSPEKKDFEALKNAAQQISVLLEESGVDEDTVISEYQKIRHPAG